MEVAVSFSQNPLVLELVLASLPVLPNRVRSPQISFWRPTLLLSIPTSSLEPSNDSSFPVGFATSGFETTGFRVCSKGLAKIRRRHPLLLLGKGCQIGLARPFLRCWEVAQLSLEAQPQAGNTGQNGLPPEGRYTLSHHHPLPRHRRSAATTASPKQPSPDTCSLHLILPEINT